MDKVNQILYKELFIHSNNECTSKYKKLLYCYYMFRLNFCNLQALLHQKNKTYYNLMDYKNYSNHITVQ